MDADFKERRRTWSVLALVAAMSLGATAGRTVAEAQEPPSIIGSSPLYGLSGATGWINSAPLTAKELKGKVVLIDFWDYSCINCIRAIPYVRAWADKYKDSGLVVIGVHTPEFDIEKLTPNVQKAVNKFGITFPVALDSNHAIWDAFHNEYWPAHYFIDAKGKVRFEHFGEGNYDQSEHWIQQLLQERAAKPVPGPQSAFTRKEWRLRLTPATYDHRKRTSAMRGPNTSHRRAASGRTRRRTTLRRLSLLSINGDSKANGSITDRSQF